MKRSLIAAAILLLLLSSTTYATPRRAPRARFWTTVLCWLGHNHHHGPGHGAPRHEYGYLPPGHRGRPHYGPGWHFGWDRGEHGKRGGGPGSGKPHGGERNHGRGRGRG